MRLLENLETKYRTKAEDVEVSGEERRGWFTHPCTQILISSLTAESLGLVLKVQAAEHMSYDIEKSMLEHTKMLAELRRIEDVLQLIEEIRDNGNYGPNGT